MSPNEILTKVFGLKNRADSLPFEELFQIIFSKMTPMHQIKRLYADKIDRNIPALLRKGKFTPVEFKLESRGGNKKVTNIHNLATFELDPTLIQSKIKKELGCSVSIDEQSGASASSGEFVIIVQGNQIYPVSEILKSMVLKLFSFYIESALSKGFYLR